MQAEQNLLSKPKDSTTKEFYRDSILKYEVISELCKEISNTETLDINVEKFLVEIADNYVSSVLDTACQIARHKRKNKSEEKAVLTTADLSIAMEKNFDIFEPSKLSNPTDYLKSNEIKNISTSDHKRRVELTREECKNIN